MIEYLDLSEVAKRLTEEFDTLIEERQEVRKKSEELKRRGEEIDRQLTGIQQTLQGLSLYAKAQETPTELTRKVEKTVADAMAEIGKRLTASNMLGLANVVEVVDVAKTLSECCRDILRSNGGWLSAVQVREALLAAGFDFSSYTSNPLSSIHTTLKRLDGVEADPQADPMLFRWKPKSQISKVPKPPTPVGHTFG